MTLAKLIEILNGKCDGNFLVIDKYRIDDCIKSNLIIKIAENKNGNIYYEINDIGNRVLMHIKDNKYIIIDKLVNNINMVNVLVNYALCLRPMGSDRRRVRVVWNVPKNMVAELGARQIVIERIIKSYEMHGKLISLGKDNDVHHKSTVYDCRVSRLELLSKEAHRKKGSKSHMRSVGSLFSKLDENVA